MRHFAGWLYFLGGVALLGGVIIYFTNIPNIPDEDDLETYMGFLTAVRLEKDFDGTDVVYLRFRDNPQVYKYLSTYPMYVEVRDRLGIYRDVEILIEKNKPLDENNALRVWGLVEHDPFREGTVVTYAEVYDEVTKTDRSWQNVGLYFGIGGALAMGAAWGIRRAVPYRPKDPSV